MGDFLIFIVFIILLALSPFAFVAERVKRGKTPGIGGFIGRYGTMWGQWAAQHNEKVKKDFLEALRQWQALKEPGAEMLDATSRT